MELIGLYLIAAGLLVVAGVAKAARPDDTARAMAALGCRGSAVAAPAAVGSSGPARWPRPRSVPSPSCSRARPRPCSSRSSYLCFFARRGLRPLARRAARHLRLLRPPRHAADMLHVVLDLALAAAATAVAVGAPGHGTLATQLAHQPWAGFPLLFVSAVGLWLTVLALSALAALDGRPSARPAPSAVAGVVSLSTALVARTARVLEGRLSRRSLINRSAFVGSAVAVGVRPRPGPQAGHRLRGHLRVRQRRLWLRQHLLLGLHRVLLRGERRQLLPDEHGHGRLVGGGQLLLLRRPPLLHGLQRHLHV